ncbi:MAG: hypothetical protein Q9191_003651 [Dirinaria sp. TL-2023a]
MIIVTIIRVSGLHDPKANAIDVVWEVHWQWVEVCVAITMVSLTAFRSFFIQHSSRNQPSPKKPWHASIKAAVVGHHFSQENLATREWAQIPGGTMTGMRSFINGNGDEGNEDVWPLREQSDGQDIRVHHNGCVQSSRTILDCTEH